MKGVFCSGKHQANYNKKVQKNVTDISDKSEVRPCVFVLDQNEKACVIKTGKY